MDKLLWIQGEFLNISCTRKRFVFKESCKRLQLLVNVEALATGSTNTDASFGHRVLNL